MKHLLRRKRFRVAAYCVTALLVLLAVGISAANRRGAGELRRALEEARNEGIPITREELESDMPPPELNAALHGI